MCVLLVEGDDLIRFGLTELLTDAGFEVLETPDAESALKLSETIQPPRLVVSDINLGAGLNGFALATATHHRWPAVPVLLMSGLGANFTGWQCRTGERFLPKPFSFNTFLHNVIDLAGKPAPRPS